MAFVERIDLRSRGGKVWQDGNSYRHLTTLAPLHYESTPDSGVFDTAIDCTPVRVQNAQLDGWRITTNGWHYALGQPAGKSDGWVGFGGRRGQNWFQFRLARVGYLYVPSGTPDFATHWHDIGGAPNYTRANLNSTVNSIDYGAEGSQPIESVAAWSGLWSTPNSGSGYARWRVDGGQLKEEIVIDQLAREWIAANRPPSFFGIPAAQTYFGLVFQLDWTDVPKRIVNGIERQATDDFNDDTGGVELRDNLDRLLAFLPIDDVYVGSGHNRQSVRLRKRFWRDNDGNNYLAVGALVGQINALPAGDLIFDPTVNLQVGATANDGSNQVSGFDTTSIWIGDWTGTNESGFMRFTSVAIPNAATINSAVITLRALSSGGTPTSVDARQAGEAADNPAAPTSSGDFSGRTRTTATVNWDPAAWVTDTNYALPDISTVVQEIVNRGGWASGNAMQFFIDERGTTPDSNDLQPYDYTDSTTFAPKLDITYTAIPVYEQEGFRWRNDDGSETTATWRQTQDTNDSVAKETPLRLRMLVNATNDPPAAHYKLQYKPPGADTWEDV